MKDIDRQIKARIAIISRGRSGDRENLREHVIAAAEEHAGDRPIGKRDIDAAFESLGSSADIRQAFFPRDERRVPAWAVIGLVASALLAALDAFSSKSTTCRSGDDGVMRCLVTTGDGLMTSLLSVMPPLVVLAAHYIGPRWVPTAVAAFWLALYVVPRIAQEGLADTVGLFAAGIVSVFVASVVWYKGRSA